MLHVAPAETDLAYPLPWAVDRTHEFHPRITNVSDETVRAVRAFRADRPTTHIGTLASGRTVELCLCDADLDEAVVTLSWFRDDTGLEYVWGFVL
jgi:hypothetical protein